MWTIHILHKNLKILFQRKLLTFQEKTQVSWGILWRCRSCETRYAQKLGQTFSKFSEDIDFPYDKVSMTTAGLRNMIQGIHITVYTQTCHTVSTQNTCLI